MSSSLGEERLYRNRSIRSRSIPLWSTLRGHCWVRNQHHGLATWATWVQLAIGCSPTIPLFRFPFLSQTSLTTFPFRTTTNNWVPLELTTSNHTFSLLLILTPIRLHTSLDSCLDRFKTEGWIPLVIRPSSPNRFVLRILKKTRDNFPTPLQLYSITTNALKSTMKIIIIATLLSKVSRKVTDQLQSYSKGPKWPKLKILHPKQKYRMDYYTVPFLIFLTPRSRR